MSGKPLQPVGATERLIGSTPPAARMSPSVLLAIGVGGALGSLARYGIGRRWPVVPGAFPWSTLVINVSGALLLGVLVTLVVERWPPTRFVRPFGAIGLCGGYTTWSTFMTETALLVRDNRTGVALSYMIATVAAGLAATVVGIRLARQWPARSRRSP
jgi:CrcB protein